MKERTLVAKCKRLLEAHGFLVFKLHGNNYQRAGLPDLLAIRDGKAYWFEIKTEGCTVTALQKHMLEQLRVAGCTTAVVRSVEELEALLQKVRS